jgi:hypothetical protein
LSIPRSQENVDKLRNAFDAMARGDFEAVVALDAAGLRERELGSS